MSVMKEITESGAKGAHVHSGINVICVSEAMHAFVTLNGWSLYTPTIAVWTLDSMELL